MKRGFLLVALSVWLLSALPALASTHGAKITIGVPHRVLFDTAVPIYVAEEKGFFKAAGLEVNTVFVKGGGENVQAVVAGDVHVGLATGLFAILSAFSKGAPIQVVSAEMTGLQEIYWYVLADSPYRTMDSLAGKRIAYSNLGSSTHMAVLGVIELLQSKKLKAPEAVALGSVPDTFTGIKTGQAEAGWSAPPFFLDRIEKGELRIAFRGDEIPKFREVTIRVNFANADFLKKNPGAARAFFKTYQQSLDFMFKNQEETVKIWMKRADLKMAEPTVKKTYDFYSKGALNLRPIKGIQVTLEDAAKFGFLKKALTQEELDRLIDLTYLP